MIQTCDINDERIRELNKISDTVFNKSKFQMFNAHKGLRPGLLHLLIGMPGGGKSTFRNSVVFDFTEKNPGKKVFIWLSEEKKIDFEKVVARDPELKNAMRNVYIYSEIEHRFHGSREAMINNLSEMVIKSDCDLFLFDNITTSRMYGGGPDAQSEFCMDIKELFDGSKSVCLLFAHTSTHVSQGYKSLIDINDIHGSRAVVKLAEYQYILQSFHHEDTIHTTARIVKHRDQNVKNKMYYFHFDEKKRVYDFDGSMEFEYFKKLYEKQNKL